MNINIKKKKIKILFIGTSELAYFNLSKILKKNIYNIKGIITKITKKKEKNSIIKISKKYNIKNIFTPKSKKELKDLEIKLKKLNVDLILIISYGLKIPRNIIKIPKLSCINLHASLLPRWRGSSPIQNSILSGDKITGISIIEINNKIDSGDILYQKKCNIKKNYKYKNLFNKLKKIGIKCILKTIKKITSNKIKKIKQNNKYVTYAKKIKKKNGIINWKKKAEFIKRQIKAYHIWPKTFFFYKKKRIIIWSVKIIKKQTKNEIPGKILKYNKFDGLEISTGKHILSIKKIQLSNRNKIKISELIKSKPNLFKINDLIK